TAAGVQFTNQLATLKDDNPLASTADFTVSIQWGDGTTSAGAVQATATPGQFRVFGTHNYACAGTYTVQPSIADDGGSTATAQSKITVTGPLVEPGQPLDPGGNGQLTGNLVTSVQFTEGLRGGGVLATFSDSDGDTTPTDFSATAQLTGGPSLSTQ